MTEQEPYTPSLEDVRNAYMNERGEWARAEFDRWLVAHDERIREEQRQKDAQVAERDEYCGPAIARRILAQGKEQGV